MANKLSKCSLCMMPMPEDVLMPLILENDMQVDDVCPKCGHRIICGILEDNNFVFTTPIAKKVMELYDKLTDF